jgi:hypothetical protein
MGLGIGLMPQREAMEQRTLTAAQEAFGTTSIAELRALPAADISHRRWPSHTQLHPRDRGKKTR